MIKKLILPVYLWAHRLMMKICWNIFIHFPLDRKKVVFSNFNGGGYGEANLISSVLMNAARSAKIRFMDSSLNKILKQIYNLILV